MSASMSTVMVALAAWSTLAGLLAWSRNVSTRALGAPDDARRQRTRTFAIVVCIVIAQYACVSVRHGALAGVAVTACAWMLLGGGYTLALNAWPRAVATWASRSGWAALAGAALLAMIATTRG
jgi:hypothetical protein